MVSATCTTAAQGPDDDGHAAGFDFEPTFRLAAEDALTGVRPPMWPPSLIENLARNVFASGNGFDGWHHLDANGPF